MKDTIKAKDAYHVVKVKNLITGESGYRIDDGYNTLFVAKMRSFADYVDEKYQNECFDFCEVFTTAEGKQFVYWRDTEIDADYITEIPALKPGMPVYIVERDEDGNVCDTTGYMFLAQACDYVIVTAWINDLETAEETLEYHAQETAANYDTDLSVFPLRDCYISKEEAQLALNAERDDDDV